MTEVDAMTEKSFFYNGRNYSKSEIKKLLEKSTDGLERNSDPRLVHALKMIEGTDVLDVGCASGSLTKKIAQMGFKDSRKF